MIQCIYCGSLEHDSQHCPKHPVFTPHDYAAKISKLRDQLRRTVEALLGGNLYVASTTLRNILKELEDDSHARK